MKNEFVLPKGWYYKGLLDLVDIVPGVSYSPKEISNKGIRIIRGGNIQNNIVNLRSDDIFLPYTYKNSKNTLYKGDIILVASTGSVEALGRTATVWEDMQDVQIGAFLRILRPKSQKYAQIISAWLSSQHYLNYIRRVAKGTSINNIGKEHLRGFKMPIPSDDILEALSNFYIQINTKISLNRSINKELETMAKQLYDYWFVQFDFPDANGKPYKSSGGEMVYNPTLKREIPQGWEVKNIFDATDVKYGFPFSTEYFTVAKTTIPVVRIRDIKEGTISAYSTEATDEIYRILEGDVLVGMDGNFHINYWHKNTDYLNQRCVRFRPKANSNISSVQVRYSIAPYIKAKESNAKGSTVGHLSDKDVKELFVLEPIVSEHFNPRIILDSILNEILANRRNIEELTTLRDELLPLLMNGQVTIK